MPGLGQTGAYAALTLTAALGGSYPAFAKLALADLPPLVLVVLRCSIASIFLGALLLRRGAAEFTALRLRDLGPLAFLGFAGIFISMGGTYSASLHDGVERCAAAARHARHGRHWRPGLPARAPSAAVIGRCRLLGGGRRPHHHQGQLAHRHAPRPASGRLHAPGDAGRMGRVHDLRQAGARAPLARGRHDHGVHPGFADALAAALPHRAPLPGPDFSSAFAWGVVGYQAILGSIAHIWWYEAVHAVGPSRAAVFMNLQPLVGVLLAWATLGERIVASGVLGGAAVLTGVALTTRPAAAGRESPPPAGASRG